MRRTLTAFAIVATSMVGRLAWAEPLFSDLSADTTATQTATPTNWVAAPFTIGATVAPTTALSATLLLKASLDATPTLSVYADDGFQPGTAIADFTLSSPLSSATLSLTTFTATDLTFDPDTLYWLVLSTDSGAVDWASTDDSVVPEAVFDTDDTAGDLPIAPAADPSTLQYSISIVPEPTTLLIIAGLAGATTLRRRRRVSR